jgi:hypothetical protein
MVQLERACDGKYGKVIFREMHRRSPEMRDYSIDQLTALLEQAGLSGVHAVSGFSSDPASDDDEVFCILGLRD